MTLYGTVLRDCGIVVITGLLMLTGFGLFAVPLVFVLFMWRTSLLVSHRDFLGALRVLLPAILIVGAGAIFLNGYQFRGGVADFQFPWPRPFEYARIAARLYGYYWGLRAEILAPLASTVGSVFLLLIAILFLLSARTIVRSKDETDSRTMITLLLSGFSLLYCFHVVIGRVSLGLRAGRDFRYATLMIPGMLALYLQATNLRHPWLRRRILLCFLILAACKSIVLCLPVGGWSLHLFENYRVR